MPLDENAVSQDLGHAKRLNPVLRTESAYTSVHARRRTFWTYPQQPADDRHVDSAPIHLELGSVFAAWMATLIVVNPFSELWALGGMYVAQA